MTDVTMPQLGETVNEGTVTKWFKKVGDSVVRGESLFEVSTDKVDSEIPAPVDGLLTTIYVEEGETVDVGTTLCVIDNDGDVAAAVPANIEAPTPQSGPVSTTSTTPVATTRARNEAAPLSPVVRRLLAQHGLNASQVSGTGPNGRITRQDVETAVSTGPIANAALSGDEVVPFTKIRQLTAEHMVRSKATSAHTLMVKEVDYEHVEETRRSHGAAFKEQEGFGLTYLAFNALATLSALRDFPRLNASVHNNELIIHHELNLGIAVDLNGEGLIVPVIRSGDGYDLRSMARKIHELADGARNKKLTVDDTANGTFTISNPGPFATLLTGAIINQPQVAILSTDGVSRQPVVVEVDGVETIVVHSVGMLALTFDHRAVDGAYAARFLSRVAEVLNTRDWAAEL
jgi:2-oxoglutarate dehydrogenase E2 component (dihydrolipoamide succinyltransferase)